VFTDENFMFMGENFEFLRCYPARKSIPLKHAVWCKNDGDTPKNVFSRAWQEITRKLCYRKEDRVMRPIYRCPENFPESLTTPTATFPDILMD